MKRALFTGLLAMTASGCALMPRYVVAVEGDGATQVSVGADVVAVYSESGGEVVVYLRKRAGEPWVERFQTDLEPGMGWYRRLVWGKKTEGGWVDLRPISCEEARAEYPWLPECSQGPGPVGE